MNQNTSIPGQKQDKYNPNKNPQNPSKMENQRTGQTNPVKKG